MNFLEGLPGQAAGETLGIRPEYLRPDPAGRLRGSVTHVERLGGDTNLLVAGETGQTFTVRLFGQDPTRVGDAVAFDFDDARALRFDAGGRRLR